MQKPRVHDVHNANSQATTNNYVRFSWYQFFCFFFFAPKQTLFLWYCLGNLWNNRPDKAAREQRAGQQNTHNTTNDEKKKTKRCGLRDDPGPIITHSNWFPDMCTQDVCQRFVPKNTLLRNINERIGAGDAFSPTPNNTMSEDVVLKSHVDRETKKNQNK